MDLGASETSISKEDVVEVQVEPNLCVVMGTPCKEKKFDSTDRMLHPKYLEELATLTRPFTLDACANPSGDNALCPAYCSKENSFDKYDCRNNHVWLNPPFSVNTIKNFVSHYRKCKAQAPTTTSACILLPEWMIPKMGNLLDGMKLIHTYPANKPVVTVPKGDGTRIFLQPGLKFALKVYYDPVVVQEIPEVEMEEPPPPTTSRPALMLKAVVRRVGTLTRNTEATVNLGGNMEGTMALDTMASRNFIDVTFLKSLGDVRIKKHPKYLSSTITLGDGTSKESLGCACVEIVVQGYKEMIWCEVLDLPPSF